MYMVHGANFYYSFSFHPSHSELTANVSNQDLPNGVPSVPVPNGSTSAYVSNQKFLSGVPSVSLPNCDPAGVDSCARISSHNTLHKYVLAFKGSTIIAKMHRESSDSTTPIGAIPSEECKYKFFLDAERCFVALKSFS